MKLPIVLLVTLTVPLANACKAKGSGDVAAGASASAEATEAIRAKTAMSVQARIGGTVIAAGDYAVEVLLHAGGQAEALVMDAKGALIADPEKARLDLTVQTKGGARAKIDLKWEAPKARFVGHAAAGVELAAGPVDVNLDVGGKASVGASAMVALSAEAVHGGQIVVAGDYSLELLQQGEFVYAFAFDASGKAHAAGDLDVKLEVGGKSFAFAWDAATMSYKAKLDAGAELDAKPVILKLTAGGKLAVGAVESFKVDARANLDAAAYAKAKLQADAKAKIEVKAPEVSASVAGAKTAGASAKAQVQVPSPTVKASASKSASASTNTGGGAKASAGAKAGFSFGTK